MAKQMHRTAESRPKRETLYETARAGTSARGGASATHEQIAALAYDFWQRRGCPVGSPEEDWRRAEQELARQRTSDSGA